MDEALVLAAVALAASLAMVVWPYRVARVGEQLDAIGSRRSLDEVEPADWNVRFTRIVGALFALFVLLLVLDL